ncbi:MAG: uncharacterized protein A8A55_1816 [Amphiamblys sp. WSBS2006]|nr:MAG: uncharacterized protein A8A55_1816 [Amphiamblys sp. WSBS2006]
MSLQVSDSIVSDTRTQPVFDHGGENIQRERPFDGVSKLRGGKGGKEKTKGKEGLENDIQKMKTHIAEYQKEHPEDTEAKDLQDGLEKLQVELDNTKDRIPASFKSNYVSLRDKIKSFLKKTSPVKSENMGNDDSQTLSEEEDLSLLFREEPPSPNPPRDNSLPQQPIEPGQTQVNGDSTPKDPTKTEDGKPPAERGVDSDGTGTDKPDEPTDKPDEPKDQTSGGFKKEKEGMSRIILSFIALAAVGI